MKLTGMTPTGWHDVPFDLLMEGEVPQCANEEGCKALNSLMTMDNGTMEEFSKSQQLLRNKKVKEKRIAELELYKATIQKELELLIIEIYNLEMWNG